MSDARLLADRIAHERELRQAQLAAFDHERELRVVYDAHERELRQHNEEAVEKARALQFDVYEARLDNLNHAAERMERQSTTFLTIDRYEREHGALIDRHARDIALLAEKIAAQESVTVRQDTTSAVLSSVATNNRWLIGIAVTSALSLLALVLHLAGAY